MIPREQPSDFKVRIGPPILWATFVLTVLLGHVYIERAWKAPSAATCSCSGASCQTTSHRQSPSPIPPVAGIESLSSGEATPDLPVDAEDIPIRFREDLLEKSSVSRERKFLELLEDLSDEQRRKLDAEMTALEPQGKSMPWERVMFWRQWTETSPQAALEQAGNEPSKGQARQCVLATWGGSDGSAALAWLNAHHDLPGWDGLIGSLVSGVARTDFQDAAQLAAEVAEARPQLSNDLYHTIAEQAVDEGKLSELARFLETSATNGASPAFLEAFAGGVTASLRYRGPEFLEEWKTLRRLLGHREDDNSQ